MPKVTPRPEAQPSPTHSSEKAGAARQGRTRARQDEEAEAGPAASVQSRQGTAKRKQRAADKAQDEFLGADKKPENVNLDRDNYNRDYIKFNCRVETPEELSKFPKTRFAHGESQVYTLSAAEMEALRARFDEHSDDAAK